MSQKKDFIIVNPWGIIIVVYVAISVFIGYILLKEFNWYWSLVISLVIGLFGIIGTVPNVTKDKITKRKKLVYTIVIMNELIFYNIAFIVSVYLVHLFTKNSFVFVLLILVLTILAIFLEIRLFYIIRPNYRYLRNYVNGKINFVNVFTFLSIVGTMLLGDFSLSSYNEKSINIKAFNGIFSISSTSVLGYWLINNFFNEENKKCPK